MKNSGSEIAASVEAEMRLSMKPFLWRTAIRPRMIDSGIETAAAQKARKSVLPRRSAMAGPIGWPFDRAVPRSPCARPQQPVEIAHIGRVVEAEFRAQVGDGLRRRRLAEDRLRDVAGQDLRADEDQDRNGEQEEDAQRDALGNEFQDT